MRFAKKIDNQKPVGGAAVAEPPPAVDTPAEQERVVAAMAARLAAVEAKIGEFQASYLEAARGAALGRLPQDSPSLWQAKISEESMRRDGLASALAMERQRLATIIGERQQREAETERLAHLARFEALVAEATAAAGEAEAAWTALAGWLWRFDTAREALFAEQFRQQHGGVVAAELQGRLRTMRARAMSTGRRHRSHLELGELLAIEAEKQGD